MLTALSPLRPRLTFCHSYREIAKLPLPERLPRGGFFDGFTSRELLLVLALIAVVIVLTVPAIRNALAKRELTRTMDNARELYLAAFHMASEGTAKSDSGRAWPGEYAGGVTTLADYCSKLVQNDYLKVSDLQRILSAPGVTCTVNTGGGTPGTVTLAGKSALKLYKVTGADPSNAIFSTSSNYVYGRALDANAVPFGDSGFVVVRKSGDAGLYKKNHATPAGFDNDPTRFQTKLGSLPGATKGNVVPGDSATILAGPSL
jgi:type II secretory pathway pseudopilin PulG